MPDIIVRPTLKFIQMGYILVLLIVVAAVVVQQQYFQDKPAWIPALLLALLIWPLQRHIRRLTAKLTVTADKLRYETGFISKSTRTIQLAKIQDVRVDQSVGQRIFGVGNLSIETAGESSRLTVYNVDRPQAIADEVLHRSEHAGTLPRSV
jgi:putative membrane protein